MVSFQSAIILVVFLSTGCQTNANSTSSTTTLSPISASTVAASSVTAHSTVASTDPSSSIWDGTASTTTSTTTSPTSPMQNGVVNNTIVAHSASTINKLDQQASDSIKLITSFDSSPAQASINYVPVPSPQSQVSPDQPSKTSSHSMESNNNASKIMPKSSEFSPTNQSRDQNAETKYESAKSISEPNSFMSVGLVIVLIVSVVLVMSAVGFVIYKYKYKNRDE